MSGTMMSTLQCDLSHLTWGLGKDPLALKIISHGCLYMLRIPSSGPHSWGSDKFCLCPFSSSGSLSFEFTEVLCFGINFPLNNSFVSRDGPQLLNFKIRWNSPHASSFPRGSLAFVTVSPFFGLITVVFAVDSCRLFQSKTAMGSLGPNIHVALCSSPASLSPASSPKSPKSRGAAKEASESTLQPPRHVESSWTRDWTSVPCNTKRSPWFLTVGT